MLGLHPSSLEEQTYFERSGEGRLIIKRIITAPL